MDKNTQIDAAAHAAESDEALRLVYGEHALFSRVGRFTLVHLDAPSGDEVSRRESQFNPDDYFFDDCPLCASAKAEGGHIVFDGPEVEDPLRSASYGVDVTDPDQVKRSPAAAFDLALMQLADAAEELGGEVESLIAGPLAERYREDVEMLHDRLIDTLWSQESRRRIEIFEQQLARALTTIADVCASAPSLAAKAKQVEEALGELASIWRGL